MISGSGYHHDLSRDESSDDDLEDAGRSAIRIGNFNNVVPVSEFDFD